MSSVYSGATITIAAFSARNATEGCFLKPSVFSNGVRACVVKGGQSRVQEFVNNKLTLNGQVANAHLATRAWTLQERVLSPRVVHFSDQGAIWECMSFVALRKHTF